MAKDKPADPGAPPAGGAPLSPATYDPTHACPRCGAPCLCAKGAHTVGPVDPKTGRHVDVVVCAHACA